MEKDPKKILKELVDEVLDEMTGTGAVGGYMTPHAFRGNKSKKASTERSIPGGKVVGKEDETDDTTINEEDKLPIRRRSIGESKEHEMCSMCDSPTGKAGQGDDSLYIDGAGPYCQDCYEKAMSNISASEHEYHDEKNVPAGLAHTHSTGTRERMEEGRYRNFRKDESMKSHTKVCFGISEAKKMLREVEFLVSIVERLKSEDGVDRSQLWKRTQKDLSEINKRTKAIARRVYRIGNK